MAGERITPVDPLSGIPYFPAPFTGETTSRHHLWHPQDHPFFGTMAGSALRTSILLDVADETHNYGAESYHGYYQGPPVPTNDKEAFVPCFFAAAGAIPRFCIDLASGQPIEREMTPDERAHIRQVGVEASTYKHMSHGYRPLRDFLRQVIMYQDVTYLEGEVDQFLHDTFEAKRYEAGMKLVDAAANMAIDGLRSRYEELRKAGLLAPWAYAEPQKQLVARFGQRGRTEFFQQYAQVLTGAVPPVAAQLAS